MGPGGRLGSEAKARSGATGGRAEPRVGEATRADGFTYQFFSPLHTFEDHVWFEDRWMVASLCDE
jgi:hypothetical protein